MRLLKGGKQRRDRSDVRATLVARCRAGAVRVLVCSDGMSRGIDLPRVSAVVNYDVPAPAQTYVHRVGRTARAGRAGAAVTVLKEGQQAHFRRLRAEIDSRPVPVRTVDAAAMRALTPGYVASLAQLKQAIEGEKRRRH